MNGNMTKILAGALGGLLIAAVVSSYAVASRLASIEATLAIYMQTDSERHVNLDLRVRDIERGRRYGPQ